MEPLLKGYRIAIPLLIAVLLLLTLTGCAPGDGKNTDTDPAGFFWGIWHGWISLISLIVGLFNHTIRVYEVHNTGWWYDLGFFLGITSGFGGLSLTHRKSAKQRD